MGSLGLFGEKVDLFGGKVDLIVEIWVYLVGLLCGFVGGLVYLKGRIVGGGNERLFRLRGECWKSAYKENGKCGFGGVLGNKAIGG